MGARGETSRPVLYGNSKMAVRLSVSHAKCPFDSYYHRTFEHFAKNGWLRTAKRWPAFNDGIIFVRHRFVPLKIIDLSVFAFALLDL